MSIQQKLIVGIAGRKQSGKSTLAQTLLNHYPGSSRSAFADPLKEMLLTFGLSREQLWGERKETVSHLLCGKTPRWAMQSLGTEWGRELIGSDIWALAWQRMICKRDRAVIVVEDVRFDNEVGAIRELGGFVIAVERGTPPLKTRIRETLQLCHPSENFSRLVRRHNLPVLRNDRDVGWLHQQAIELIHGRP